MIVPYKTYGCHPSFIPTLSHHMKILVDNELASTRKDGTKRMYRLNHKSLDSINNELTYISSPTQHPIKFLIVMIVPYKTYGCHPSFIIDYHLYRQISI